MTTTLAASLRSKQLSGFIFSATINFKDYRLPPFSKHSSPMTAIPILRPPAFLTCAALLILSCPLPLMAQVNTEFQITKIEPSMPLTPAPSFNGTQKTTPTPKKWLEVEVTFTWKPRLPTEKFADDVAVNYYVLLNNKSTAVPQGTLLNGQVIHTSIPANQTDLRSVMYISPRTLERFFDGKIPTSKEMAIVDIGVTITRQGQVVAEKILKGTGSWWTGLQQTPGYLLNKNETPFAPLYWEYYEAVKKP